MLPRVSVVIPSFNYAHFIGQAIQSVIDQTFTDWELHIIDDASTDGTEQAVRPFLPDARVHFRRISHSGVAIAKNVGVEGSRAPLIAFLDADDFWFPRKLERQIALFDADPGVGLVYSRRILINEHGRPLHYAQPDLHRGRVLGHLLRTNFICQSSAVVRRGVFQSATGFDPRCPPVEDYDLWLRIARQHAVDYVDEPLVAYRTGHASLSSKTADRLKLALTVMDRVLGEHEGRAALKRKHIRRARADTYLNLALALRDAAPAASLSYNLKGLVSTPTSVAMWKSLVSLAVPERGRRVIRRALGRPLDWQRAAIA
jgi:glycosyltransferase involved in cell wall biosynthesis